MKLPKAVHQWFKDWVEEQPSLEACAEALDIASHNTITNICLKGSCGSENHAKIMDAYCKAHATEDTKTTDHE